MQSTGRGGDTMLVHMNPKEVAGLQQLAMAHGGSLTINPQTGLPEAGFLSNLLPTIIGAALNVAFPGLGAVGAGLITGAGTGLMTGNLKKGLMAGLGAFGGAGLGAGLTGASTLASAAPVAATATAPTAQALTSLGLPGPATAAATAVPASSAALGIQPNYLVQGAATTPPLTAGQSFGANNLVNNAAANTALVNPTPVVGQNAAPSVFSGIGDRFAQAGSGLKNIITNQNGAGLDFLNDNKMNLISSLGSAMMTPEEKELTKKITNFDVIAEDIEKCAQNVKDALMNENYKKIKLLLK